MKFTRALLVLAFLPLSLTLSARADGDAVPDQPREAPPREGKGRKDGMDRFPEKMAKMMQAAMQKAARLEADGKKEEAEAIRREANEKRESAIRAHQQEMQARMQKEMRDRPGQPEPAGSPGHPDKPDHGTRPDRPHPEQMADRLRHLEQAIAHLREAGLPEPAADLTRLAERMRQAARPPAPPRQRAQVTPSAASAHTREFPSLTREFPSLTREFP